MLPILEKKAGTTLEEEGHGEAHGAVCPDQVGCVPGGVQEEGWFDGCEIEHRAEGGHRLQTRLKTAHLWIYVFFSTTLLSVHLSV